MPPARLVSCMRAPPRKDGKPAPALAVADVGRGRSLASVSTGAVLVLLAALVLMLGVLPAPVMELLP